MAQAKEFRLDAGPTGQRVMTARAFRATAVGQGPTWHDWCGGAAMVYISTQVVSSLGSSWASENCL